MEQYINAWNNRNNIPRIKTWQFLIYTFLCIFLSAISTTFDEFLFVIITVVAAAFLCINFTLYRSYISLLVIPLSFVTSFFVTKDIIDTLFSLLFIILAFIFSYIYYSNCEKTFAIVCLSIFFAFTFGLILYSNIIYLWGNLSDGITSIETIIKSFIDETFKTYSEIPEMKELLSYITDDIIEQLINTMEVITPGFIIFGAIICGYFTLSFMNSIMRFHKSLHYFKEETWNIEVSKVAAYIYLLSFVMSSFLSFFDISFVFQLILLNICIVFTPAMVYAAITNMFKINPAKKTIIKLILFVSIIALLLTSPILLYLLVVVLSIVGAFKIVKKNMIMKNNNHSNNQ